MAVMRAEDTIKLRGLSDMSELSWDLLAKPEPPPEILTDGGLTLKLKGASNYHWCPDKQSNFELLVGKITNIGITNGSSRFNFYNNMGWQTKHSDSPKYYAKFELERGQIAYLFEKAKDNNIIEKMIYYYHPNDVARILYKGGQYSIDEPRFETEDKNIGWSIRKEKHTAVQLFHNHPLTDKIFEARFIKRSKRWVCQGCGRRAPKEIEVQIEFLR